MTLSPITRHYTRCESTDRPAEHADGFEWFAGGTDLIPLTRTGVIAVDGLADLKTSDLPGTIERTDDGWKIGALATLSDLADHDDLVAAVPAIADAVNQSATAQIRHRATVGGNLLQRPRCSYFRDSEVDCWMKGGTECPARAGRNAHHALVDEPCVATQPSDLASVLVALGATVDVAAKDGSKRSLPVADLLRRPTSKRRSLHALAPGDVIRQLTFADIGASSSTYIKAMDRAAWQFALVGVAAIVGIDEAGDVSSASLVASGVDSAPRPLDASIGELIGRPLATDAITDAARRAADGLIPLSENGYKIALLSGLVQRALERLSRTSR